MTRNNLPTNTAVWVLWTRDTKADPLEMAHVDYRNADGFQACRAEAWNIRHNATGNPEFVEWDAIADGEWQSTCGLFYICLMDLALRPLTLI
jgi:hypothetical protein